MNSPGVCCAWPGPQDYAAAALIRDELQARGGSEGKGGSDGNWEGIGTPAWLADWLVQIGFPLPLEVQRQSMTRLMSPEGEFSHPKFRLNGSSHCDRNLMNSVPQLLAGGDALILSQTGSGKTLSYLIPILVSVQPLPSPGASSHAVPILPVQSAGCPCQIWAFLLLHR